MSADNLRSASQANLLASRLVLITLDVPADQAKVIDKAWAVVQKKSMFSFSLFPAICFVVSFLRYILLHLLLSLINLLTV